MMIAIPRTISAPVSQSAELIALFDAALAVGAEAVVLESRVQGVVAVLKSWAASLGLTVKRDVLGEPAHVIYRVRIGNCHITVFPEEQP